MLTLASGNVHVYSPNKNKLKSSPNWHPVSSEYRYEPRLVLSARQGSAPDLTVPTNSGMELMDAAEWDRCNWWKSDEAITASGQ